VGEKLVRNFFWECVGCFSMVYPAASWVLPQMTQMEAAPAAGVDW
jgi:hypothetical protein